MTTEHRSPNWSASLVGKIFPESIATKNRQRLVCLLQVSYSFFSMFTGTHSYSCWKEAFQEFCKDLLRAKTLVGLLSFSDDAVDRRTLWKKNTVAHGLHWIVFLIIFNKILQKDNFKRSLGSMNLTVLPLFLPFTSKRSVVNLAKFSETFTERKRGQDS